MPFVALPAPPLPSSQIKFKKTYTKTHAKSNSTTHPLPVAEERADEGERHRHQEPECQKGQEGGEGDGCARTLVPEDEVHQEEEGEHNAETGMVKNG